jgi:chemotaxis protein CheX
VKTKTVILPCVLDLKAAAPLTESLLASRGHDLLLDASQVERLGGQCLQVLVSAMLSWHADGISAEFSKPSDAFIEGLASLGMQLDGLSAVGQAAANERRAAA